jgi:predicted nucleic acid-binding Zn ribbon protein
VTWHPAGDPDAVRSTRLGDAIEHFLKRRGRGELVTLSRVAEIWDAAVGAQVANHVRPAAITDDTLVVDVDQPAWSIEVNFMAPRILATLEAQLGNHVASAVKARVRGRSGVE